MTRDAVGADRFPFLRSGPVPRLLAALGGRGEDIRLVGGAVRNALMGLPVSDFDCATTALPEEVMRRAAAAGLRNIPTGLEHGTVTVLVDDAPFEVTTLREDIATDGRRASVRFGRDFRRDAERRDFTINALYLDAGGRVFDDVGGEADIAARRLRFIGDPATRIREDYLRILRFFRFHAAYGEGPLDGSGLAACVRARHGLDLLSRERVRTELLKLLAARGAVAVIGTMAETGLLGRVLGGVAATGRFAAMAAAGPRNMPLRLAALALEVAEDAERLKERLRLSNEEVDTCVRAAAVATELRRRGYRLTMGEVRPFLYRYGELGRALAAAILRAAGASAALDALAVEDGWAIPRPPFAGRDLVAAGVPAGPAVGRGLAELEQAWIEDGFPRDGKRVASLVAAVARRFAEPAIPR